MFKIDNSKKPKTKIKKNKKNGNKIEQVLKLLINKYKSTKNISQEDINDFLIDKKIDTLQNETLLVNLLKEKSINVENNMNIEEMKKIDQKISASTFGEYRSNWNEKSESSQRGIKTTMTSNNKILVENTTKFLLNNIGKHSILTAKKEKDLISKINHKKRIIRKIAIHSLVNCNLRLVYSIANRFTNRGLDISDLFNEGVIGLYHAINKFNPAEFKNRFSTYATWWVRQSITRSISEQTRLIRLPIHMVDSINLIYRKEREFLQLKKRVPTTDELAIEINRVKWDNYYNKFLLNIGYDSETASKELKKDLEKIVIKKQTPNNSHIILTVGSKKLFKKYSLQPTNDIKFKVFKKQYIEKLKRHSQDVISLEKPVGEEEESVLSNFIKDETIPTPYDEANNNYRKSGVQKLLKGNLSIREYKMICMRYGISPYNRAYSLNEISDKYNVTNERVRQIFSKIMTKLHNPTLRNQLKNYYN